MKSRALLLISCILVSLPVSAKQIDLSEKSDVHQVGKCKYFLDHKVPEENTLDAKTDALVLEIKKILLKHKTKLSLKDEAILRNELSNNFLAGKIGEAVPTPGAVILRQIFKQSTQEVQAALAKNIVLIGKSTPSYLLGEINQEKFTNTLPQCTTTLSKADDLSAPQPISYDASADRGSKGVGPHADSEAKGSSGGSNLSGSGN